MTLASNLTLKLANAWVNFPLYMCQFLEFWGAMKMNNK